jgi:hypothetical protein
VNEASNRLAVLAAEIRSAHSDVRGASENLAQRAYDAGKWLAEAKGDESIPRGGWERWVEQVAGVPHETAKRYIQLFNAVSEGRVSIPDIAEAGQIGALKAAREKSEAATASAPIWTEDELARRDRAEAGECVVANMRDGCDEALIAWAQENDRYARVDRKTEWGNPFEMPDDGDRDTVCTLFERFYLPHKAGLLRAIPTLRGKVLGCWCHPEQCHGHIIAEIVNQEAGGRGTAEEIADQLAGAEG